MGNGLLASHPGNRLETMSQEIEIGLGKRPSRLRTRRCGNRPSRRTRDPEDVSTSWQIDAYEFDVPVIGAPWIR